MSKKEITIDTKAQEAVDAQTTAAHAVEVVRQEQLAVAAAERAIEKRADEGRIAEIVKEQLENVLAAGSEQEKTFILARVKYVCQDIKDMKTTLQELTKLLATYPLVKTVVFSFIGLVLIAFIGAVISLVIMK